MQRRDTLQSGLLLGLGATVGLGTLATLPRTALAHHGWSSFDQQRPIYLEGRATDVKWRNPHAEFVLQLANPLQLPPDLANRPVPPQTATVDGAAILAKAILPTRRDARWEVELAPMFRMGQWQVPEITEGMPVAMVGFTFIEERGSALCRVEYLFVNGRTYGMRSSPV
jgi:hypothetical protein